MHFTSHVPADNHLEPASDVKHEGRRPATLRAATQCVPQCHEHRDHLLFKLGTIDVDGVLVLDGYELLAYNATSPPRASVMAVLS